MTEIPTTAHVTATVSDLGLAGDDGPGVVDNATGALGEQRLRREHGTLHRRNFGGVSVRSRLLSQCLRMTLRPILEIWARASHLPWPMGLLDNVGSLLPPTNGTRCRPVTLPNCSALWVKAAGAGHSRVVLYLHGGGFLFGSPRTHLRLVSRISGASQAPALMVDYRMLPKHTISDAVDDGVDAYRWLLATGYRPDQVVIAGDSAGGYLAFMVSSALGERGVPAPAAIVTMSPLTEMDPTRKREHANSARCALLPTNALAELARLTGRIDARVGIGLDERARICPVDRDLHGMPPTLIQVGSHEALLVDAELMAERLATSGTECELQIWNRQMHVFQSAADLLPEARQAITEIGRFIQVRVPDRLASVR